MPGDAQPRGGPSRSAPSTSAARHAVHSTTVKVTRVKVTRGVCGNPHGRPVRRRHMSIRCSVGSARSPRAPQGASSTAKSSSRGSDIFVLKMSPEDERKGRRFGPRAASAAGRSRADRYYRITRPSLYGTPALSASPGCSRRPPPRPASTVATRASTSTACPCCPRTVPCRTGDLSNETSSPVSRRGSSSTRRASFSPCSSSHAGWWSPRRTRSPALSPRAP